MNDNKQTLTLDGQLYVLADLPKVVRNTFSSLQFVEARLQQLRVEMAVSQTAHVAYARALKAALIQVPGTVASTTPSP